MLDIFNKLINLFYSKIIYKNYLANMCQIYVIDKFIYFIWESYITYDPYIMGINYLLVYICLVFYCSIYLEPANKKNSKNIISKYLEDIKFEETLLPLPVGI